MKKLVLSFLCLVSVSSMSFAATGFFGNAYVVAGNSTFYQAVGNDGVNPQLSSGFGSLTQGGTFNIKGFEINTFNDNGSSVTHMNMFWTVNNFATTHQIQLTPETSFSGNNKFWQITSATQNLLTNNGAGALANGSYTFKAYFEGYTNNFNTPGNIFLNNGGANYSASFTVVPEPTTWALLAGSLAITTIFRRRRAV